MKSYKMINKMLEENYFKIGNNEDRQGFLVKVENI